MGKKRKKGDAPGHLSADARQMWPSYAPPAGKSTRRAQSSDRPGLSSQGKVRQQVWLLFLVNDLATNDG